MSSKWALRPLIMNEALARQGTTITCRQGQGTLRLRVEGGPDAAEFERGGEGLVHRVTEVNSGTKLRLKCFWEPNALRRDRSRVLVQQQLADPKKSAADALGGAPLVVVDGLGGTTQFGVLMKNVGGMSWKWWLDRADGSSGTYPPAWWPGLDVRLTWAYGLAYAVNQMEERTFIHADLSPGNVVATGEGEKAGDMALVDFDGFVCPSQNVNETELRGTDGFAAPEIWDKQPLQKGSDRVGMAILIQQFLLAGYPDMPPAEAFRQQYTQVEDLCNRRGQPHPCFRSVSRGLAELLEATLGTDDPAQRPGPDLWCSELWDLYHSVANGSLGPLFTEIKLHGEGGKTAFVLPIPDHAETVDLAQSGFGIRASFIRGVDLRVLLRVHRGASVRVKDDRGLWHVVDGGDECAVAAGMLISDPETGKMNARVSGTWRSRRMAAGA